MNVGSTTTESASSSVLRAKQQIKDGAAKDEARAQELQRSGIDDLFSSRDHEVEAHQLHEEADALKEQAQHLQCSARTQSKRGIDRLTEGSEKLTQGQDLEGVGLDKLHESYDKLGEASGDKAKGLRLVKAGLEDQGVENTRQAGILAKFDTVQSRSEDRLASKEDLQNDLSGNLKQREQGLTDQASLLNDYLVAGQGFAKAREIKTAGFEELKQAGGHRVQAEALHDAKQSQELRKDWALADQGRHEDASLDLSFSSLYQYLKGKAEQLRAEAHGNAALRDGAAAESLDAQAAELKERSNVVLRQARCLEQSGQCHVVLGRQMQCCPWTYCQGVQLERQGCAEIAEAQQMKAKAGSLRAQAQEQAFKAEELRATAEGHQACSEELSVQSHGSQTRSDLLAERAKGHDKKAEADGSDADAAGKAAKDFSEKSLQQERLASEHQQAGTSKLSEGFQAGHDTIAFQKNLGLELGDAFSAEKGLVEGAQHTVGVVQDEIRAGLGVLAHGGRLLHKMGQSQKREGLAQAKVADGIQRIDHGLTASEVAQKDGVEATKLLEQARELELEGLRLQNRGQKMLLEAGPKFSASSKLSAESYDVSSRAEQHDEEAASLVESGRQKIEAAQVLRDKAARLTELAES